MKSLNSLGYGGKMNEKQALIVVDVQNDFLETGALPVPCASEVIPVINRIIPEFRHIVFTQDWHPKGHISFADNHPGKRPYEAITLNYGEQILWPTHCVQETLGAQLAEKLDISKAALFVKKGTQEKVDSYSAFLEADRQTRTILENWLRKQAIEEVFVCGLATDFCVSWTALDAANAGFKVTVIEDASRGINANNSIAKAKEQWQKAGIVISNSESVIGR